VNRRQQEIIEFQNAQIQALMNKLGRKRILLTDDQRRALAVKGKALGRKTLSQLTTIVTPDTILRWHRRLIAAKWDFSDCRAKAQGRPPVPDRVVRLVLRFAKQNPTWGYDGFLLGASYLLIDRDTKFLPLRAYMDEMTDTKIVLLPPRSPNLNAHLERYMRSLKSECLDKMIFFGRRSLERALKQFVAHYHRERNHQGLENRIIDPGAEVGRGIGEVQCRERLGGMLRYYYREAA
jgi:hypothetical protein